MIIDIHTNTKPLNQKEFLRKMLYTKGYDVPTSDSFTTHDAIILLHKLLNGIELTNREKEQRIEDI